MIEYTLNFISQHKDIFNVVWMSLLVSISSTLIAATVALICAIPTALKNFRGKRLLLRVTDTLMSLPPVLMGLVIYLMLSKEGPLGSLELLFTPLAMIISQTFLVMPIIFGMAVTNLSKSVGEIQATCISLGAGKKDTYITIIRETKTQMLSAVTAGFGRAISEVGAVMMVGGNIQGETRVMTTYIALETGKGNFQESITIGVILLMISFIVNYLLHKLHY